MSKKDNRSSAAHRLVHTKPPHQWHDGFPLGNGALGAMVWGDGDPLALTLDHVDCGTPAWTPVTWTTPTTATPACVGW